VDLFINTIEAVALILGIGVIGTWIIAKKIVPITILEVLSPLVIQIALPALIFTNIVTKFNPEKMSTWWTLPLWWMVGTALISLFTIISLKFTGTEKRAEFGISLMFPNAIFFPLAILPNLFGTNSTIIVELFIFTLLFPAFVFNTYFLWFRQQGEKVKFDWKKSFNPVLSATILAIFLKLTSLSNYIPHVAIKVTGMLGALALPLIVLLIGGNIFVDFQRKGKFHLTKIIKFVLLKNIIFPALLLPILIFINPPPKVAFLIFLMGAVPPLTAVPILTQKEGGDTSLVNQFIVSSFIFSVATLPVVIFIFSKFFDI